MYLCLLGVKIDASPGQINQISLLSLRPALICDQCSETCEANHRFIPIVIERVNLNYFSLIDWTVPYTVLD